MAAKTFERFGKVDILVNNAGVNNVKPFMDLSEEEWDTVVDTSLKGYYNCCQAFCKDMLQRKSGSVINMTSVFGAVGLMNLSPYSTSRGGIVLMSKSLAIEWARSNVRVNALAPSYMRAGLGYKDIESNEMVLKLNLRMIPMKRGGEAWEIHGPALFLASDASTFVTGTVLFVDGGWTAM